MRSVNSIKNIIAGITMQIFVMLLNFLSRAIFVRFLNIEYLGVNGLFSNILSMLNLAELGIGSVIIYNLYKPLATKDKGKIISLIRFYRLSYNLIGVLIFAVGICLTPFLHVFVKEIPNIPNLKYIYILFLLDTCSTYFLGYKSAILEADQKNYILSTVTIMQQIVSNVVMIIILIITRNYVLFLISRVVIHVVQNILIMGIVNKRYPYIKSLNSEFKLKKEDRKKLFMNLRKVIVGKVGDYCVLSTDNLIISYYLGVYYVGLLSNYALLINAINGLIVQFFNGMTASFGNVVATETNHKKYSVFKKIMFLNFWISGFCMICLYVLINPFILLWLGENYILEHKIVLLLVLNFFILSVRTSINIPRNTAGLFTKDSFASLIEAAINLFFSIFLVKRIGIAGVLLGTTISAISVQFFTVPYFSYKYLFKERLIKYYLDYFKFLGVIMLSLIITTYLCNSLFLATELWSFIGKILLCCIIPNAMFLLIFRNIEQFEDLKNILEDAMLSIVRRKGFLRYEEKYFCDDISPKDIVGSFAFGFQCATPKSLSKQFKTLHIDLKLNEEEIFNGIEKNTKYKINRAIKSDNLTYEMSVNPDSKLVDEFNNFYNIFAKDKGITPCNKSKLMTLNNNNALAISFIRDKDNQILCYHIYITDKIRGRLLYSASHFRISEDNNKSSLIGRANRLLHWLDIKYFKNSGYMIYDFGGLFIDESIEGNKNINRFKLGFGGKPVIEYHTYCSRGIIGKLILLYLYINIKVFKK